MHVLVPSGDGVYPITRGWHRWGDPDAPFQQGYFPVIFNGGYHEEDLPTFWHCTHGRRYNNVSHGKPVGFAKDAPIPFSAGGYYFPSSVGVCYNNFGSGDSVYYRDQSSSFQVAFTSVGDTVMNISAEWVYTIPYRQTASSFSYKRNRGWMNMKVQWVRDSSPVLVSSGGLAWFRDLYLEALWSAVSAVDFWSYPNLNARRTAVMKAIEPTIGVAVGIWRDEQFLFNWSHCERNTYSGRMADLRQIDPFTLPTVSEATQIFSENEVYLNGVDPLVTTGRSPLHYWRGYLISEAYYDACRNVPRLSDNSISNIIEIAGFIKSLVIDKKIEIPKSLSSAWLAYRYQYCTTKLDAEEAIKFVHRHMDLQGVREITSYGRSSHIVDGTEVVCQCCFHISPRDVGTLDSVWRSLYTYGLTPSFYTIWDMIPFSFVVDWLIPIGEMAQRLDATGMYSGTYYDISDIQFSLTYDVEDASGVVTHWYTRWVQGTPPQLIGFYAFEDNTASSKVVGYRILDTAALILG